MFSRHGHRVHVEGLHAFGRSRYRSCDRYNRAWRREGVGQRLHGGTRLLPGLCVAETGLH